MPKQTYAQNKASIYRYVEANRSKINEYNRIRAKDYREENAEIIKIKKANAYRFKCEWKRLCNILLD